MIKKCKICNKEFEGDKNKKYCSDNCKKRAYKNYSYSSPEAISKYREKIKEEEGLTDTEFNYVYREKTAANKGMTVSEYNKYLEERKAERLGITVKELRHYTYISKKTGDPLYECLNMSSEEYYKRLKR